MTENSDAQTPKTEAEAVSALIAELGGVRPAAKVIGSPFTTVQYWKRKGSISPARRSDVRARAAKFGVSDRLLDIALPKQPSETLQNEALSSETSHSSVSAARESVASLSSDRSSEGNMSEPSTRTSSHLESKRAESKRAESKRAESGRSESGQAGSGQAGSGQGALKPSNGYRVTMFVALFLSLSAFGMSGWVFWQQNAWVMPNVVETFSGLEERVEALEVHQDVVESKSTQSVHEDRVKSLEENVQAALAGLKDIFSESQGSSKALALLLKRIEALETKQIELFASGGSLKEKFSVLSDDVVQKFSVFGERAKDISRDYDLKIEGFRQDLAALLKAGEERLRSFAEIAQAAEEVDLGNFAAAQRVLSVLTLRHVSRTQAPFQDSLEIVKLTHEGVESAAPIVEDLSGFAQKGVRTYESLLRDISDLTARASQGALEPVGESWWHRFVNKFLSLVKIRKTETDAKAGQFSRLDLLALIEQENEALQPDSKVSVQAILVHLDKLKEISPNTAMVFDEWRSSAEARIKVDFLTLTLVTQSVARVASATK